MKNEFSSVKEYIDSLPEERKKVIKKLRKTVKDNIPKGFKETISYDMIGYVVPHKLYPEGYHCTPELPLPFINIASQKSHIGLYHLGIYSDKKILQWFTKEYANKSKYKLDMEKSCIRFKKLDHIPFELIGELVKKISVEDWIKIYETNIKKS